MIKELIICESENVKAEGQGIFYFANGDILHLLSVLNTMDNNSSLVKNNDELEQKRDPH